MRKIASFLVLALAALVFLAVPALAIPAPIPPDPGLAELLGIAPELGALISFVLAAFGGYLLRHLAAARRAAEIAQDLAKTVEPLVEAAEAVGGPGVAKYARVLRQAQAWLDEQGIKGEPRRLLERDLPELIEAAVRRLPK